MTKNLALKTAVFATFITALVSAAMSVGNIYQQSNENQAIDSFIESHELQGSSDYENALKVMSIIRDTFNTNEKTFQQLNMATRPFLRESTLELLTYQEGLCGEGTRVIISILHRLGYDATRLTLYNRELQSAHTLISLKINGNEYILDSINTNTEFNKQLSASRVDTSVFNFSTYTGNILDQRNLSDTIAENIFAPRYWIYSYEAVPYTKLFNAVGINVRAFNFDRPVNYVSWLAERPYAILSIFYGLISMILLTLSVVFFMYMRRKSNLSME